ncbi:MAG: MOSC domain-containing protein [Alphaproteobacteria bacterium]|nr:MOSC domain-containing protein [Alphaproteobacteria bacterium]
MPAHVKELWRYPVKGIAGERLVEVAITPSETFPFDRRFAVAHGDSAIKAEVPHWELKTSFHMLMHGGDEGLASLTPSFDEPSGRLTIKRNGAPLIEADTRTQDGLTALDGFFRQFLNGGKHGTPRFVMGRGVYFGNIEDRVISLISLSSVRDLARAVGASMDERRFRGNVNVEGLEPWVERGWVGRTLRIGSLRFQVVDETIRCGATTVNPANSQRDLNVPKLLNEHFGHAFCGVYLKALDRGQIKDGATLSLD